MRSQIKFDKETHPQRLDRYPKSKVKNGQALNNIALVLSQSLGGALLSAFALMRRFTARVYTAVNAKFPAGMN
ncbi:MAG: hypothetical protein GY803_25065 [Chloroflexi bacterium]|nr:hypothetical protein [Chloroflexota bacterium]